MFTVKVTELTGQVWYFKADTEAAAQALIGMLIDCHPPVDAELL